MTDPNSLNSNVNTHSPDPAEVERFGHLLGKYQLIPHPFRSSVPVIGPVIAWFRTVWNSVSTRWYLAPLLQQQSEYNHSVVRELQILNQTIQTLQVQIHRIGQEQERQTQVIIADQQALRTDVQTLRTSIADLQALRTSIADLQALRTPIADLQTVTHHLSVYTQQLEAEQQNLMQFSDEISDRLTAMDQDFAAMLHDLAKVTYTLIRIDELSSNVIRQTDVS